MFKTIDIRKSFPILQQNLLYFDNAATSATCAPAIEAMDHYYRNDCFSIHRGTYSGSVKSEMMFEDVREKVKRFINAPKTENIIFTSGSTDALNLVSQCFLPILEKKSNIIVTELEHHSNYLPWKRIHMITGCTLKIAECTSEGLLEQGKVLSLIDNKTKVVAISASSNVTGIIQNLSAIIKKAHENGAKVIVDASQLCAHQKIDVEKLDCDFLCFSAHKMYGPTGCGVLYGKTDILNQLSPSKVGGGMVHTVGISDNPDIWDLLPYKFEPGTSALAEVIGLGATIDYLQQLKHEAIIQHEKALTNHLIKGIRSIPGIFICGGLAQENQRISLISFSIAGISSYDIGLLLSAHAIAVRTGTLCAQPLMKRMEQEDVIRVSLSFYNTKEEIDTFIKTLFEILNQLQGSQYE